MDSNFQRVEFVQMIFSGAHLRLFLAIYLQNARLTTWRLGTYFSPLIPDNKSVEEASITLTGSGGSMALGPSPVGYN